MQFTPSEKRTLEFYEWEKRGRGWYIFPHPVDLEPEFVPFFPKQSTVDVLDDAKRPSLLGGVLQSIKNTLALPKKEIQNLIEEIPVNGYPFVCSEGYHVFTISFPQELTLSGLECTELITMLSACRFPVSFEIVASDAFVRFQFVCRTPDKAQVQGQLKAYFPDCIIQEKEKHYLEVVTERGGYCVDFGIKEEFMRPMAQVEKSKVDPLQGLFGILDYLEPGESIVYQVLCKGILNPWASSILTSVSDGTGGSFFVDAPEMPKLAAEKVSAPLFAASIRLLCQAPRLEQAHSLLERIGTVILRLSSSPTNELTVLNHNNYSEKKQLQDIFYRESHRAGMLLNSKELACFIRLPLSTSISKKLERNAAKTKAAPAIAEGHDLWLGRNVHQGIERIPTLNNSLRLKHMHVIGATGTGKSTFLQSCIVQDILLGNGIAVLDPHGDLIESILPHIPPERHEDVILIDPADSEFPVGFNILSAHSDIEKEILSSDLVAVFRRLSTSFGDQMHSVLANAILAFLESSTGGTLIDLRRFLIEKPFRESILKTVSDPNVIYYWQKEYPLLKTSSIGPILTRLDSFLRPKPIRYMAAQKKSLDFENILDSKKILLIKLSQGLIGTENSYLLGTFFVSKIYQAAMARQIQSKTERQPFFLYIDEFQNFITPSLSFILSGTRKYGLGCVLAHQDMIQLSKQDSEIASAVISNAGTRVCFRLGDIDAKRLEDGFSDFEAQDLQNLGLGQAIARVEKPENDFNIETLLLKELPENEGRYNKEKCISISRSRYGTPRKEVEDSLAHLLVKSTTEEAELIVEKQKVKQQPVEPEPPHVEVEKKEPVVEAKEVEGTDTKERLAKRNEKTKHRYIQTLIKTMAEARGYKASIEHPTPDGQGSVDVLLEKDGKSIACEVGVTTTKQWESHNVEKCLNAGYDIVIAVAMDKKAQKAMEQLVEEKFSPDLLARLKVMDATSLFQYLDRQNVEPVREKTMKGYRVKVEYGAGDYVNMQESLCNILSRK